MAHLTGQREFWGLEFRVTPDVLIPRPETEFLIETVLTLRPDRSKSGTLVDVGTGSGCIAVALAIELPAMTVIATDTSQAALEVARANATRHGVAEHIDWRHGSLLAGFSGPVDLIVSNPPYVSALAIQHLEPEIRDHEPHLALNGGSDGAVPLRALVAEAGVALVDDGLLVVEFGCNQETAFRQIIAMSGLSDPKVVRDLQGLPRIGVAAYRDSR